MTKNFKNDTEYYIEQGERTCARCGLPVKLDNLHPDSLEIPTDGSFWEIVHGDGETCCNDERGWVIQ